jgi:hypothetical protein
MFHKFFQESPPCDGIQIHNSICQLWSRTSGVTTDLHTPHAWHILKPYLRQYYIGVLLGPVETTTCSPEPASCDMIAIPVDTSVVAA